jgi:hypothetical protein
MELKMTQNIQANIEQIIKVTTIFSTGVIKGSFRGVRSWRACSSAFIRYNAGEEKWLTEAGSSGDLVYDVGIHDAVLLQVVRDGVLGKQRGLQANFRANPLAFIVRRIGGVVAAAAAAELGAEVRALNFVILANRAPGLVAYRAGDVDFQSDKRHRENQKRPRISRINTDTEKPNNKSIHQRSVKIKAWQF